MALKYAPLFFGVSAIALPPFLEFADLAGASCLLLEVFPLVRDFVGLHFLLLEGDFSSGRALEDSPLRGRFLIRAQRLLALGWHCALSLVAAAACRSVFVWEAQQTELIKGGALSERSGCGGCVFYGGWKVMQGG